MEVTVELYTDVAVFDDGDGRDYTFPCINPVIHNNIGRSFEVPFPNGFHCTFMQHDEDLPIDVGIWRDVVNRPDDGREVEVEDWEDVLGLLLDADQGILPF